jgi:hypothetical protein
LSFENRGRHMLVTFTTISPTKEREIGRQPEKRHHAMTWNIRHIPPLTDSELKSGVCRHQYCS